MIRFLIHIYYSYSILNEVIDNLSGPFVQRENRIIADELLGTTLLGYTTGLLTLFYHFLIISNAISEKTMGWLIILVIALVIDIPLTFMIGEVEFHRKFFKEFKNDKYYPHVKWNITALMVFLGALLGLAYFVSII